MTYESEHVAAYYDGYGEREWDRLERTLPGRISYAIHRRLLDAAIRPGMRVADLGSGPGRFAIDAARAGARVTLVDVSARQLAIAREKVAAAGVEHAIDGFVVADICALQAFADGEFDLVVCFGGAVSYVRKLHPRALAEMVRMARPGASLLVSVMSLYGTLRMIPPLDAVGFLERAERHVPWDALLQAPAGIETVPGSEEFHQPMTLFTSASLREALDRAGADVVRLAAANPITLSADAIPRIEASAEASHRLLELALCEHPALVDAGAHLVAGARTR